MTEKPVWSGSCLKNFLIALQVLFLGLCIAGLYSDLGRYSTGDQALTVGRYDRFYERPFGTPNHLDEGSQVGKWTIGIIGNIIKPAFHSYYESLKDTLNEKAFYPNIFHYLCVSVVVHLLFLAAIVWFFLRLFAKPLTWTFTLFTFLALLNYPLFKALLKILKYDALSIMTAVIAVLVFVKYRITGQRRYFLASGVISGLAFIEKDTTFSVIVLLIIYEFCAAFFTSKGFRQKTVDPLLWSLALIATWLSTVFAFVPWAWRYPYKYFSVFSYLLKYFALIRPHHFFYLIVCYLVAYLIWSFTGKQALQFYRNNRSKFIWCVVSFLCVLVTSAVLYQDNNVINMSNATQETKALVAEKGFYVAPSMVQVDSAYETTGVWSARLLASYNVFRLFCYSVPELFTIFLVFFGLLFAWKRWHLTKKEHETFSILLFFAIGHLLAYGFLIPPIEAKYMVFAYLMVILASLVLFKNVLGRIVTPMFRSLAILAATLALIYPAFVTHPYYFGYQSLLRSAEVENTEFLQAKYAAYWTWVGWGEASYECTEFLDTHFPGPKRVAYDYDPPFYYSNKIEAVESPFFRTDEVPLDSVELGIEELANNRVDFLFVSKSIAFRLTSAADLVKTFRSKSICTAKRGPVELAWVFRVSDLVDALH